MVKAYQSIEVPRARAGATPAGARPPGATTIGRSFVIAGEVRASEDITVLGRIEGPLICEDGVVVVAAGGTVDGDIVARDITVHGVSLGQLVATEIVDVRSDGTASGTVIARRFFLEDGGVFRGRVEPQLLDAAVRVARFNQQRRDADT